MKSIKQYSLGNFMHHSFPSLIELTHAICRNTIIRFSNRTKSQDLDQKCLCIDGTCGNGHDSKFMLNTIHQNSSKNFQQSFAILSFDVQQNALNHTKDLLKDCTGNEIVSLINSGHENLSAYIPDNSFIGLAMYNLGYLPGSDKTIVTHQESTISSFKQLLPLMVTGSMLSVHSYSGHPDGKKEADAVADWFTHLPYGEWRVAQYEICNKKQNQERLFFAEKIIT